MLEHVICYLLHILALLQIHILHYTLRCQASCVAVTTAIALMLQRAPRHIQKDGSYNIDLIIKESYDASKDIIENKEHASVKCLNTNIINSAFYCCWSRLAQ